MKTYKKSHWDNIKDHPVFKFINDEIKKTKWFNKSNNKNKP